MVENVMGYKKGWGRDKDLKQRMNGGVVSGDGSRR